MLTAGGQHHRIADPRPPPQTSDDSGPGQARLTGADVMGMAPGMRP
jgi:hypothetical protein